MAKLKRYQYDPEKLAKMLVSQNEFVELQHSLRAANALEILVPDEHCERDMVQDGKL